MKRKSEPDEESIDVLEIFAELKLKGSCSEDQKALYWDIINTVQYARRLQDENESLREKLRDG